MIATLSRRDACRERSENSFDPLPPPFPLLRFPFPALPFLPVPPPALSSLSLPGPGPGGQKRPKNLCASTRPQPQGALLILVPLLPQRHCWVLMPLLPQMRCWVLWVSARSGVHLNSHCPPEGGLLGHRNITCPCQVRPAESSHPVPSCDAFVWRVHALGQRQSRIPESESRPGANLFRNIP